MNLRTIYFLLMLACPGFLVGQSSFEFQEKTVLPGTKAHFLVPISDGTDSTFIPISVFHGRESGPVLGITAGVHGYEYPPIMAGQALIKALDPTQLKGTIVLVQAANLASFLGRSPFINPQDGKNLNRSFPGNAQGSLTERIAHFISTNVISRVDFFLDMHGGDASEDLMPYGAYYHHEAKPAISEQGKKMAYAMGFDHVVVFMTTGKDYMQPENPSLYCSAEAFKRGIPAIDIECGKLGRAEPLLTQKIVQAVTQLLAELKMYEGAEQPQHLPIVITERDYISSGHDGIFYSEKRSGNYVAAGMEVGYVTNFFGEVLESIKAPHSGILLLILGTPPVNKGETLAVIGRVDRGVKAESAKNRISN